MNELYAVHGGESIFSIVKANSKEEAFNIFARNQIEDENLNKFITELGFDGGLYESFYKDDRGYLMCNPKRLEQFNEQEKENYIDSWVEKNVNQFWSDEPEFAKEYLKELNKAYRSTCFYQPTFSQDFWVATIKRIILHENWYEDFDIVKIDLAASDYQLIYRY